uniref:Uncharacterized protein n=1 Tax=viral metagenome TaxID=1070528 RepID=A0A6M3ILX6_9ZZZZ
MLNISGLKLPMLGNEIITGDVFFVDSNGKFGTANDTNDGKHPNRPLATWDGGINKCTASRGDYVLLMPGHAETVAAAAGIDLDVIGVTTVGLGYGALRSTITFATAITADVDIDAASNTIRNVLFVNGLDNMTAPIDVNAADFTMIDCETRDNDTNYHVDDFIFTDGGADRLSLIGWIHRANGGKTGPLTALRIRGGPDDVLVIPKWIDGDFSVGCISNDSTACTQLQVFGSAEWPAYMRTRNAADVICTAVATTKGRYGPYLNLRLQDDGCSISASLVGADMEFFAPIGVVNADGERSVEWNGTQSDSS